MLTQRILRPEIARAFVPLLRPARYKGLYGGRGGAKSHFFAEQIIARCLNGSLRVVCIREVQNSIKDSVRQLLIDKIVALGVEDEFDVLEAEIRGPRGSMIIFKGMQSYNATNIKSLEGYDIAWVEEAQTLSQTSLDLLRPTIRKPGSELWFSWNPMFKTDAVDLFLRKHPPKDAIVVQVNWRDNPWFPQELADELLHDFMVDADKAEHIWNGAYGHSTGAILAKWINKAERENRVHDGVTFERNGAGVMVSSDIGFRDTSGWWYWQPVPGGFKVLAYDSDNGLDASEWIPRIQQKLVELGVRSADDLDKVYLPHDARVKTFQSKHSSMEKFIEGFGADKVRIVPQSKKMDQISAARTVIDRCEFNRTRCEAGLDGLIAWEYEWLDDLGVFSQQPLHNWASHPADGFCYGAQTLLDYVAPPAPPKPFEQLTQPMDRAWKLDDIWSTAPNQGSRRV